jgi:hypothetical protein
VPSVMRWAARQDALNCASVKIREGLTGQDKFLKLPDVAPFSENCLCGWTISDHQ